MQGRSKYGAWNRMWRGLRDLFAVRWMMSRHIPRTAGEITDETANVERDAQA